MVLLLRRSLKDLFDMSTHDALGLMEYLHKISFASIKVGARRAASMGVGGQRLLGAGQGRL